MQFSLEALKRITECFNQTGLYSFGALIPSNFSFLQDAKHKIKVIEFLFTVEAKDFGFELNESNYALNNTLILSFLEYPGKRVQHFDKLPFLINFVSANKVENEYAVNH